MDEDVYDARMEKMSTEIGEIQDRLERAVFTFSRELSLVGPFINDVLQGVRIGSAEIVVSKIAGFEPKLQALDSSFQNYNQLLTTYYVKGRDLYLFSVTYDRTDDYFRATPDEKSEFAIRCATRQARLKAIDFGRAVVVLKELHEKLAGLQCLKGHPKCDRAQMTVFYLGQVASRFKERYEHFTNDLKIISKGS